MRATADGRTPPATQRVRVRRLPERGEYDRATIDAILDATLVGHVGYVVDGQPYVTPTIVWRDGDRVLWHGSAASRMLRETRADMPVCITITHVDALVLARSGFNHSMNYRSLMILGRAHELTDEQERLDALRGFVDHLVPGRWAELRPPTRKELKATTVLWTDLAEASAKIRTGGPHDDEEDLAWPTWAGVVPIDWTFGRPVPDASVPTDAAAPAPAPRLTRRATGGTP